MLNGRKALFKIITTTVKIKVQPNENSRGRSPKIPPKFDRVDNVQILRVSFCQKKKNPIQNSKLPKRISQTTIFIKLQLIICSTYVYKLFIFYFNLFVLVWKGMSKIFISVCIIIWNKGLFLIRFITNH